MTTIDRRALLAGVGALIGAASLPASALAAGKERGQRFLAPQLGALVTALADTLIPRTDTPGAVDAGVPAKFDGLMQNWASAARRADLLAALQAVDAAAMAATGKGLALLPADRRTSVLRAHDAAHLASDPAYAKLKELLVSLYYLSEPGATRELRYEHAPGAWEASIPLTPQTRAWAGANVG